MLCILDLVPTDCYQVCAVALSGEMHVVMLVGGTSDLLRFE